MPAVITKGKAGPAIIDTDQTSGRRLFRHTSIDPKVRTFRIVPPRERSALHPFGPATPVTDSGSIVTVTG